MAASTKEAILKYLKDAIDQETAIVQQKQLIQQADAYHTMIKPTLKLKEARRSKPQLGKVKYTNGVVVCSLILCIILVLIGLVVTSDASWEVERYTEMVEEYGTRWQDDLNEALQTQQTGNMLKILGFLCLIPAAVSVNITSRKYQEEVNKHVKSSMEYDAYIANLNSENEKIEKAYIEQMQEWEDSFSNMRVYMNKPLSESLAVLASFYASDVIYPKYRTLPALTSIYEYFITGRCDELTGPHGAYNLYEDELRKDTVISQLNTVIENLEQIKNNQYMLYQQVKAIQENTAVIASELQQIKGYTIQIAELSALNAYYAALNERNTRITMYYHL